MKNFQLIAQGIEVRPLLHAIQCQPKLWNQYSLRTMYPQSPHHQAEDIWLRFNTLDVENPLSAINDKECINYDGWHALPQARQVIFDLMHLTQSEQLGRVIITKLAPGKEITPHEDGGAPATFYQRYHVMLQNGPGSLFHCGDETVTMQAGEIWWFNNELTHSVVNNSRDDRITMIVDSRPAG